MSNKEITKLALKIFSIYVLVQALLAIPQFFQAYVMLSNGSEYNSANWFLLIGAVSILVLIILSVIIWKLSTSVTSSLHQDNDTTSSYVKEEFALSLLGLYIIVFGLTRLVIASTSVYYLSESSNDINNNITQNVIYLIVYFLVSVLGISLVIKSHGWVSLLNKLRLAGIH